MNSSSGKFKPPTIAFFGLGSIGLRLAKLIKENFDCNLVAFRTTKNAPNDLFIEEIYDISEIHRFSPDVAFITNPTSIHMDTAIYAASLGMHLFIEKPLCNNLDKWCELQKIVLQNQITTYVACNLRFDPIIQYLKKSIDPEKIFYATITSSSFLPEWRPSQDYRTSYSSKKALGGGVLLDLIHESDYCNWLFGLFHKVTGTFGKLSELEIETEDCADITLFH